MLQHTKILTGSGERKRISAMVLGFTSILTNEKHAKKTETLFGFKTIFVGKNVV